MFAPGTRGIWDGPTRTARRNSSISASAISAGTDGSPTSRQNGRKSHGYLGHSRDLDQLIPTVDKEYTMHSFTLPDLVKTIQSCLGAGMGAEVTHETLDTEFDDLGYDSLSVYELMTRLQDHTGVQISDEDIESITTPRQAIDFINARRSRPDQHDIGGGRVSLSET